METSPCILTECLETRIQFSIFGKFHQVKYTAIFYEIQAEFRMTPIVDKSFTAAQVLQDTRQVPDF
jgi:hypothetical protein